jgi:CRISPR/Cas system-associated endonuclease Cas1
MDIEITTQLGKLLSESNFKGFIVESQKILRNKENNLLQIVLTQQARLKELEDDMIISKLSDEEIQEAEAHIRGTLYYVLTHITPFLSTDPSKD